MRASLVPHQRPRILALDFSEAQVKALLDEGFNARRGSSGSDDGSFSIPWAIQDVEVAFVRLGPKSFNRYPSRPPAETSIERKPVFAPLASDILRRHGWLVVFIETDDASQLDALGIGEFGVREHEGYLFPRNAALPRWASGTHFPTFRGEAVHLNDVAPEAEILRPYLRSATWRVLDCPPSSRERQHVTWLATDDSADRRLLALRRDQRRSEGPQGGMLLLPDFGQSLSSVVVTLLRQTIPDASPELFDSPEAPWLAQHLPHPVQLIRNEQAEIEVRAKQQISQLEENAASLMADLGWLLILLSAKGDELTAAVARALRFLSFDVAEIDRAEPGKPKREDLHVVGPGYFALAEVKGTDRGASEEFISDVERYLLRHAREGKGPAQGMLVVNHSIRLDPRERAKRFYSSPHLHERCVAGGLAAVDSVALYGLCQDVLAGRVSRDAARVKLQRVGRFAAC